MRSARGLPGRRGRCYPPGVTEALPGGRTWIAALESAPFPWRGAPGQSCSEVLLHAGAALRPGEDFAVVLWLHGQRATLRRDVLAGPAAAAQLDASGVPAVLVAPQLAYDARDSCPGKLEEAGGMARLLDEAADRLGVLAGIDPGAMRRAPVVIAAFSGGYRAAASCLVRGGRAARGALLLDALYARERWFADWLIADPARSLVVIYGASSAPGTEVLARSLERGGVAARRGLPASGFTGGGAWLVRVDTEHGRIPALGPPPRPLAALLPALLGIAGPGKNRAPSEAGHPNGEPGADLSGSGLDGGEVSVLNREESLD